MSSALTYIVLGCAAIIVSQSVANALPTDPTSISSTVQTPIEIRVGRSNYTYTPGIGAYKIHSRSATWNVARRACQEEGGHLVIVNSVAEAQHVGWLLNQSNSEMSHVGLHDLYQEDDFVTIHGDPLAQTGFDEWRAGEPNNGGSNENCVTIFMDGKMNDVPCSHRSRFICELPDAESYIRDLPHAETRTLQPEESIIVVN